MQRNEDEKGRIKERIKKTAARWDNYRNMKLQEQVRECLKKIGGEEFGCLINWYGLNGRNMWIEREMITKLEERYLI